MAYAISREELFKVDNYVLATLGVVALIFGYLSLSPPKLTTQEARGEKIAQLMTIESTVKRKSSEGLAWDAAAADDQLYGGDQIFTDNSSNATVKFKDGSEIAVAENSLIKIEQKNGKTTIDMSKGFVSGKFGTDTANFAIKMGGTSIKLEKGAEIQVKVDPNNKGASKISLISGKAAVDSGSGAMTLSKDQLLSVDTKTGKTKIEDIDLKIQAPAPGAVIDDTATDNITFKWSSSNSTANFTVVIARDPLFKTTYFSKDTTARSLSIPVPPGGNYYWKVVSTLPGNKKDQSVELLFTVNKLAAPDLVSPIAGKKFQYEDGAGKPQMSFIWKGVPGAGGYEIEIATDKSFGQKSLVKQTETTSLDTKELDGGTYYWRVRARSELTKKYGGFSAPADFVLLKMSIPDPPQLDTPANESKLKPDQPIAFKWQEAESANGYQIQISRTRGFENLTTSSMTSSTSFSWSPEAAGGYYWRVRSVDKFERETKFSPNRKLVVDGAVPQLILPESNAEIILTVKTMKIDFQWLETTGAESYQLEISSDQNFKKIIVKKKLAGNSFKMEAPGAGIYFWRVKALLPGGAETAWSNSRGLALKDLELLAPPVLQEKYYFRIPPQLPGTAFIRQFFRLISLTDTAYAQDADVDVSDDAKVSINWKPVEGAEAYYIELANDKSFDDIIIKKRTASSTFNWPEARAGRFWLRAAAVDRLDRKGDFSRLAELTVSYRAPYLVEPEEGATVKTKATNQDVDFTWQFVKNANYTLEVSQNSNFSKLILSKQLSGHKFTTDSLKDGKYYWRVKAQYLPGLPTETAKSASFTVVNQKLPPPLVTAPASGANLIAEATTAEVTIGLSKVPAAGLYEIELARDANFTKVLKRLSTTDQETGVNLPTGSWYVRARSGLDKKNLGDFGESITFNIKSMLPAPVITKPKDGLEISSLGSKPKTVAVHWRSPVKTASYQIDLASDDDFEKIIKTESSDTPEIDLNLVAGKYYIRVRGIDSDGQKGLVSKSHKFEIEQKEINAPELKFPDNGELLGRRKNVNLQWKKEAGYDGYKLVLSRDKNFKQVISEKELSNDNSTEKLPESGEYYWYVEGKNKKNQYAMRSDVQSFTISDYAAAGGDRIRIVAGFAPSIISNAMTSDSINNAMSVTVINSFMINGQYWFNNSIGLESAYHRKSTDLYEEQANTDGTSDQEVLAYTPQNFDAHFKYRKQIGVGLAVPEFQARIGYMYKTFYSFYAQSRTSLSLQESTTQNVTFGVGGKYPFSLGKYLEAWADYASTVASKPVQVSSGSHIMFDGRYYMMFPSKLNAGVGYRYANGVYQFNDESNRINGTLEETTHSLIGALGYGF